MRQHSASAATNSKRNACGYVSWKMGIGWSELSGFGTFEVGKLAESEGYHPDISFGWSSATVPRSRRVCHLLANCGAAGAA
jgi:hypothetical protein